MGVWLPGCHFQRVPFDAASCRLVDLRHIVLATEMMKGHAWWWRGDGVE